LTAGWETSAVTVASVRADLTEAGDVLVDLSAEGTLDEVAAVNNRVECRDLCLGQLVGAGIWVDACFSENVTGKLVADAMDVLQRIKDLLAIWDVYTCDTGHWYLLSSQR
jgi:hypothetical protein